jgi:ligand-binding SRPBCC domain-containing protein
MPTLKIQTHINAERTIVFDLARSIDLHKLSTQHTNEEAIAGVTSGLIGLNESVTWRARHFGIYQKLTSKITAFESPNYFVDEMQKGIFKEFKHEHIFEETENGTLMIDIFNYISPLGIIGRLADYWFLKKYMKNLLVKRNSVIKEFAEKDNVKV